MSFLRHCCSAPSVASLLSRCTTPLALRQIHARIIHQGLEQHHAIVIRLLSLSGAHGHPSYASFAFDRVTAPTLLLWNALLAAHAPRTSALALFNRMRHSPVHPDAFTLPPLIRSCSAAAAPRPGAALHCLALLSGLHADVFVCTALVDMYGKCSDVAAARDLFDTMTHRNEVSWTAMIVGYLAAGDLMAARILFDEMPERNVVTWNAMIDGYVKAQDLIDARKLFDEMPERNAVSFTTLMNGYAKAGDMASARSLFDRLKRKDMFAWSAMISGYAQNGHPGEALKIFLKMYEKNIKPDEFVLVGLMSACSQSGSLTLARWVDEYISRCSIDAKRPHVLAALIDMHAKCGNMDRASFLFDGMSNRDLISYCSMMQGYAMHGSGAKAVELFSRMLKEGLSPDEVAFTVLLAACSHAGLVEEGNKYFELMKNRYMIVPTPDHYACMVDLLGRAGRLKDAYELIKTMPVEPHVGTWGALLGACRLHCDIELGEIIAKQLFKMEPQNAGNYVLLSNIYASADKWTDVSKVRMMMRGRGVRKIPGCTWI